MAELLGKSANILTPGATYGSIMEAVEILVTTPPPSISSTEPHHQTPLARSPRHQASSGAAGVPSFVASAEEEDTTVLISGVEGIVGMPPMQLGAGGVTAGNLNFFAPPSEITGEGESSCQMM